MPWTNLRSPDAVERIISGLCYLSFGLIGLLYIVINGKSSNSPFFRFHFLQAILLSILGVLLNWTAQGTVTTLSGFVSFFGDASANWAPTLFDCIATGVNVISKVGTLLLAYGLIWALLGKYAEIPFVSQLVRQQIR